MADTGNLQPLISDEYREMQESMHEDAHYGVAAQQLAPLVAAIIAETGARTVLDYGAGKGGLRRAIVEHILEPVEIFEYDPAIPEKASEPVPADLVVNIDVLEHIEPDRLDNVLDHIKSLALGFVFLSIGTKPAAKVLPDGRNAHLIQEDIGWWLPKLQERFEIHSFARVPTGFWVTGMRKT